MSELLVSIIIPCYNSEKTISEALFSILTQEFNDFELLIIDGESKDNTLAIIKETILLFQSNIYVQLVSEKDNGIYDAINKGIGLAKGKWIYILGSDDKLHSKTVLSTFQQLIKDLNTNLVYGDVMMKNERCFGEFDQDRILQRNICQQAIFYDVNLFVRFGLFDLRYKIYADYIYNIKCFFNTTIKKDYISLIVADYSLDGVSSTKVDDMYVVDYPSLLNTLVKGKVSDNVLHEQYAKCGLQLIYKSHYIVGITNVMKAFVLSGNFTYILMMLPKFIRKPFGIHTFWN